MCVEGNRNHGVRWMRVLALLCPPVLLAENAFSQIQTPQNWSSDMNFKHGDHAKRRIGISLKDTGGQNHEKRARFQFPANRRQSRDLVDSWGNPGWVILTSPPTDAPAWAYPGYVFVPTPPVRSPGVSTELQPVPIAQTGATLSSLPAQAPQIWSPVKRTWQPSKIFPLPSPVLVQPAVEPAVQPFAQPVATLTLRPVVLPTVRPTPLPTARPIPPPTSWPTLGPTPWPTLRPTPWPTLQPTLRPTPRPTPWPTTLPAAQLVMQPTQQPVIQPAAPLILNPTISPTVSATNFPSSKTFDFPSSPPTGTTYFPSQSPTALPTQDRFGTDSRIITNENGDTGIVDFCRRSLPANVLETVMDQAVVFDYELHLRTGSNPQLAIDFISTQVHRGLVADQMKCNWPAGNNSSNESEQNASDAPFYLSALSSLPVDFVRVQSADTTCVDSDEYDCFIVDAAVTAKIFSLGSRRKLETQINITDMAIAETMDESLRSVFTNPGLLLEMSSIVGIMYKGLTNGPEGFTPRFSDPTTDESQARDSIRTGALVGAIIGGILGFCLLRWLAGCLCTRCMGGGNGTPSDAKSDTNDRVVFSTEDEESDERNKSQDEHEQSQNRSLLDDTDDDEYEMNMPIYSVEQPPHVWPEGHVDDDSYFYDSDIHRNPTTGIDVVDDLMRVEERRYRHPDTMDL